MSNIDDENKSKVTEQIDLLIELMKVKSSVKKNISEDYTLAYLKSSEKDYIAENYQNAEYAKSIILSFLKKETLYEYNYLRRDWKRDDDGKIIKVKIPKDDEKKIKKMANRTFEFFMVHPHMIAILNRNKSDNFLVKLLGKEHEEDRNVPYGADDRSMLEKIKDKLTGNEPEVYEED